MSEQGQEPFDEEIEDPVREANWPKVLFYTYLQLLTIYGAILVFSQAYVLTTFYSILLIAIGVIGITAGAHRLWAHKTYTACTSLKIFLMLCQTLAGQGSIYDWVMYHRLHHAHFGTNVDPFNPTKGFFYSHFLCLTQKVPPEQEEYVDKIDMSDLEEDSVVMFQKKYYWLLYVMIVIVLPIYIPLAYWGESLLCAGCVSGWMRYGITLHFAWLISSATTIFGLKKGEKYPSDTNIVFLWYKTYWLQYHYMAPWDYQTGEYGKYGADYTTLFIRVCAALDLAKNLRTIDCKSIQDSLYMSMDKNKDIAECLIETEANVNIAKDYY